MDGPRMSYKVKFKSEREKQKSNIKTYTWNLEKQYRWSYLQSRNKDIDVGNKYMDTKGEGRREKLGEWNWHIYTIDTMFKTGN